MFCRSRYFVLLRRCHIGSEMHPASGDISPGVRRSRHEADLSPPSSYEVKSTWNYTFIHPHLFMMRCSVTHWVKVKLSLYRFGQALRVPGG
jgi:hypothetical protein